MKQEWEARYNGKSNGDDYASSIAVDNKGNVFVTGESYHNESGGDIVTIKYNSSGIEQWNVRFQGISNEEETGYDIACDVFGNVFVCGNIKGEKRSYVTIKYDTDGNEQWAEFYTPENNITSFRNIIADDKGNVYSLCGTHTLKYNTEGKLMWVIENPYSFTSAFAIDNDGNVYQTTSGTLNDTCRTYKYNSDGVLQWTVKCVTISHGFSIVVDKSGNAYVAGDIGGPISNYKDFLILKYNSSGDLLWTRTFNGMGNSTDQAFEIKIDLTGDIIVTGGTHSGPTNPDVATIKYTPEGVLLWASIYALGTTPKDLKIDFYNNIYIIVHDDLGLNFRTLKYNSNGILQWEIEFDGGYQDSPRKLEFDRTEGSIYAVGGSEGRFKSDTTYDYVTLKYSQDNTEINQISTSIPSKYSLSQNYPNPFNPITNIEFTLPQKSFVKLKIFDFLGKEVSELINESLSAGTYRFNFNAINLTSGTYFYKLETSKFTETKKMILVK